LMTADREGAYIITDRATYLTAKRDKVLSSTVPLIEGGATLLNPCSALINIKAPYNTKAREFASWLGSEEVQQVIGRYGQSWSVAMPIFSIARQDDMIKSDRLAAKL
jgi:ABC-type tungstate transport system permease subunit